MAGDAEAGTGNEGGAAGAVERPGAPPVGTATRQPLAGAAGPLAGVPGAAGAAGGDGAGGAAAARPGAGTAVRRTATSDLSEEGLASRLARVRQTEAKRWSEALGVDDPTKVKERLARAEQLEKEAEERKRSQMTELDRFKADLEAERAQRTELEKQLAKEREDRLYEKQDATIERFASEVVDSTCLRLAKTEFASHLRELGETDPKKVAKMTERDVRKWFADWVKEHPKFAREAAAAAAEAATAAKGGKTGAAVAAAAPARRALTNGASPRRAAPAPAGRAPGPGTAATAAGKTPRPGQKNSMSKQELKEYAKGLGINYPG